jgi:hypothetical protein
LFYNEIDLLKQEELLFNTFKEYKIPSTNEEAKQVIKIEKPKVNDKGPVPLYIGVLSNNDEEIKDYISYCLDYAVG